MHSEQAFIPAGKRGLIWKNRGEKKEKVQNNRKNQNRRKAWQSRARWTGKGGEEATGAVTKRKKKGGKVRNITWRKGGVPTGKKGGCRGGGKKKSLLIHCPKHRVPSAMLGKGNKRFPVKKRGTVGKGQDKKINQKKGGKPLGPGRKTHWRKRKKNTQRVKE